MIRNWVNYDLLEERKIEGIKKEFNKNKPFKHVLIRDFLKDGKAGELLDGLMDEDFIRKESDLFSFSQTNDLSESKSEILKSFYLFLSSKEFAEFIKNATGINVKPSVLDLSGSLYQNGDYLLCHDDQLEDRKIAYIFYLSKDFNESDGGNFVLFDNLNGKVSNVAKRYPPKFNSLMVFAVNEVSFHAVEENISNKDRIAIGGWLHD